MNPSETLALSGNYIQALLLQEVSDYKPVLTAIPKTELCKEAGLQVKKYTMHTINHFRLSACKSCAYGARPYEMRILVVQRVSFALCVDLIH